MSDFNKVVNYLRYTRRSDEAREKNGRAAVVVDYDFVYDTFPEEEEIIYLDRPSLNNASAYQYVDTMAGKPVYFLYLKTNSSNKIDYYIWHKDVDGSTTQAEFKKLPQLGDPEIINRSEFVRIPIQQDVVYDFVNQRCIVLLQEEVYLFEDVFNYHPKDISLKSGAYDFDYEDNKGYLTNLVAWLVYDLDDRVIFAKSKTPKKVNFFPSLLHAGKMRGYGRVYGLQYNYYERGIPNYSIVSEPAIRIGFFDYGALLSFLNATLFYVFDDYRDEGFTDSNEERIAKLISPINISFETKQRKIFTKNYRKFVKELMDKQEVDPLKVLFYLPRFYFTQEDKGFLWEAITSGLKSTTTNAINKNEDTVLRVIKLLVSVFYQDNPEAFLEELTSRAYTRTRSVRRGSSRRRETKKISLIERLIENIQGDNFSDLMLYLISLWIQSSYAKPENRTDITNGKSKEVLNPPICGYTSGKSWSFFHENTNFRWTNDGLLELEATTNDEVNKYKYHPMDLIAISNAENEPIPFTAIELGEISILPAFALYAHSDVTFWKNTVTVAEYVGDVVSLAAGLGPAWRALRIVSAVARANSTAQKIFVITRSAVGVMEVVASTGNIILKTTQYIDTPLGQKISRALMWMEFASLGVEASVGIAKRLSSSARIALEEADKVLKTTMKGHALTRIELQQMGYLMLSQLEGARYIVGDEFNRIAGALAQSFKAAGVQILEISIELLRSLESTFNKLLDDLGFPKGNSTQFEFAMANGRGYLASLNGKGFFAVDAENHLKNFFDSMSDFVKKNPSTVTKGGKTLSRMDAAFEAASESISYNRIVNGDFTDIIHNGKVIERFSSKEAAEEFLRNIYKGNQKLFLEIYQNLNQRYRKWLDDNNFDLQIVVAKKSTRLKIVNKADKKVIYQGVPDRVHSYLKAEQLLPLEREALRSKAYDIARNSSQKFNLKIANGKIYDEFGFKIRRSKLGSRTLPTFRNLGLKMFIRNSKLGNGRYDRVIKSGFSLKQIENAVEKIKANKGIAINIRLTGNRRQDFNYVWDSWGIPRNLGNALYDNLYITLHHMDNVKLNYRGTFELVHTDLHDLTIPHTGNFGILGIMLDLIE
jgi:hypothetical protein